MPPAPLPSNEEERLKALLRYDILDTKDEEVFDRITELAREAFDTPVALISLLDRDRQWFKSKVGLNICETPREQAFCSYAVLENEPLIVPNALEDERFADNPLVTSEPHIRFYAGAPIRAGGNLPIGTLCIIDFYPRDFSESDVEHLRLLAGHTMQEIEMRYASGRAA